MLLFAALLAAVVNPVVFSPFLYPLETWSPAIQGCVYTAIALYGFVGLLTLKAVLTHEPAKPLEWLWAFVFIVLGWLYVVTHFTLQAVAFIKVFIGKEGAWEVTERCARRPPERCGPGTFRVLSGYFPSFGEVASTRLAGAFPGRRAAWRRQGSAARRWDAEGRLATEWLRWSPRAAAAAAAAAARRPSTRLGWAAAPYARAPARLRCGCRCWRLRRARPKLVAGPGRCEMYSVGVAPYYSVGTRVLVCACVICRVLQCPVRVAALYMCMYWYA